MSGNDIRNSADTFARASYRYRRYHNAPPKLSTVHRLPLSLRFCLFIYFFFACSCILAKVAEALVIPVILTVQFYSGRYSILRCFARVLDLFSWSGHLLPADTMTGSPAAGSLRFPLETNGSLAIPSLPPEYFGAGDSLGPTGGTPLPDPS